MTERQKAAMMDLVKRMISIVIGIVMLVVTFYLLKFNWNHEIPEGWKRMDLFIAYAPLVALVTIPTSLSAIYEGIWGD